MGGRVREEERVGEGKVACESTGEGLVPISYRGP